MSARAAMRAVSPALDEVVDMVEPLDTMHNNLALSSATCGMEHQIQTANRPVVLCVAPKQSQDPQLCGDCKRLQNVSIKPKK
ncbi:unnamed protein product, partial [Mesorhabditis spiculigera]